MIGRNNSKKDAQKDQDTKILEVAASMQGSLVFKDPVNLRINGSFQGSLDTKGTLIIGEKAVVKATIVGETVRIAGEVIGDVKASEELELIAPGRLIGDLETPVLVVREGAVIQGKLNMIEAASKPANRNADKRSNGSLMNADELASYLAVEKSLIFEWADSGKLPAVREGSSWKFDKNKVDEWVASGRIK